MAYLLDCSFKEKSAEYISIVIFWPYVIILFIVFTIRILKRK